MAAPSSAAPDPVTVPPPSAAPDPVTAPPPSAANPPRPFPPSFMHPVPLRPTIFTAQSPRPPPKGFLFSASRGFTMRGAATAVRPHPVDQTVTVANPAGYIRSTNPSAVTTFAPPPRPFVFSADHVTPVHAPVHAMRPPQLQPAPLLVVVGGSIASSAVPIPAAQPKVASIPNASPTTEYDNCKDRDKNREDNVVTIHGRKVRVLDGGSGSLYALCRSWVRNGLPQESQPNFGDDVKLLPRPLPAFLVDNDPAKKSDGDNEAEVPEKEPVCSVEQLSTRNLLEGLVKRSKRVRAQFRMKRIRRIARYKHRLSLLLPSAI